jgi:integrase/recombinase XerD
MANASIILHTTKKLKGDRFPVVLRVTHERIRKYYKIGEKNNKEFSCTKDEWDDGKQLFRSVFEEYKVKNAVLRRKVSTASNIIVNFENESKEFTFKDFEIEFLNRSKKITVETFFSEISADLLKSGRVGYSNIFTYTKNAVIKFSKPTLTFKEINYAFLSDFESHLRANHVKSNSIFVYMRTLRTAFNMAIKNRYIKEPNYPFRSRLNPNGYSIEHLKKETIKRAISQEQITSIFEYPAIEGSGQYHAKNFFVFSFLCRGMNFHDMAHLKWKDINNGRINYIRQKTGGNFTIAILPEINTILNYYHLQKTSEYVFPILDDQLKSAEDKYKRIKNALKSTNYYLKDIASECDIDFKITSYVSRHTWATLMKQLGVGASIIKEGLGHQTEAQTETYLKGFENDVVDDVNAKLAKLISRK